MFNESVQKLCPHCGAKMKEWKHALTPGLISIFLEFAKAVKNKGINEIHLQNEVSLSKNGYNNFQKLRYFGLVAKVKDENDQPKAGYWLLTRLGIQFLKGMSPAPKWVMTFRNRITEKSEELVFIDDVQQVFPRVWFQKEFEFNIAQGKLF